VAVCLAEAALPGSGRRTTFMYLRYGVLIAVCQLALARSNLIKS
jgi:hypothetical protein